ncbi:MAG: hypothetical protein Q9198_010098 [Flavoplaca austrocitrina]
MPTLFNYQVPPAPPNFIVSPFPGLALTNILGRGGAALILSFPYRIVFKTPLKYRILDDWSEKTVSQATTSQGQAEWCIENEKALYAKLAIKPHRNLLKALLVVDEGIFLPRIDSTLEAYTMSWGLGYPEESTSTKHQWITQIAAGAAWLEALGFVHNDIRPGNVLINGVKTARLAVRRIGTSGAGTAFPSAELAGCPDSYSQLHVAWLDQYGIGNCIWVLFQTHRRERPGQTSA